MSLLQRRTLSSYGGQYFISSEKDRFELFYSMIPYLKELESYILARDEVQKRREQNRSKLSMPILTILSSAVLYTVLLAIPFLIIFYIVVNVIKLDNGMSLFSAYEEWLETKVIVSVVLKWLLALFEVDNFLCQFISVVLNMAFVFLVVPCLYFLFPIALVLSFLGTIFSRMNAKAQLKEDGKFCEEIDQKIEELVRHIGIPLQNVPSDYQYSEALEYFCNCYINGRANTLQEAIAAYDTYLHRRKMEHAQEVIHNDQTKILNELHEQQEKMDRMQECLRRVKNKIDWL